MRLLSAGRVAATACAVALVVAIGLTARHSEASAVPSGSALGAGPAASKVNISEATIERLAAYGVLVKDGADVAKPLSPDAAVTRAVQEFGLIVESLSPTEQELMLLTIPDLGVELQPDPSKESRIDPLYVDRPVWALFYERAEIPIIGHTALDAKAEELSGERQLNDSPEPATYEAPFVIFLDAQTGEVLDAESL